MQKSQFMRQPTCEETQMVSRSSSGMVTVSINLPPAVLNSIFCVPSADVLMSSGSERPMSNFSESISLFFREMLVISSMLFTRFRYTQSAICLAVNLGRFSSVTLSVISASVMPSRYCFCSIGFPLSDCKDTEDLTK